METGKDYCYILSSVDETRSRACNFGCHVLGTMWYRFMVSHFVCVFRLGLKSFEKDVSGAVMDIQADEEEGMRQAKSLKKWYKKTKLLSTSFPGFLSFTSLVSLREGKGERTWGRG